MTEQLNAEQVFAVAATLAAQHVNGITGHGPTTKRHRGAGAFLKAVEPLDATVVAMARDWALRSDTAATLPADAAEALPQRVPIVLPDGQVTRADPREMNAAALNAAQITAAAEAAVLMAILRKRIERITALERLRAVAEQVEALGGSGADGA